MRRPISPLNVLFTSVGRRVELIKSFCRAYKTLGISGNIIGGDIDPLAPALHAVDQSYGIPRLDSPEYIPTLVRLCRHEGVNLIFPLIDPDISVLARAKSEFEAVGTYVAICSPPAVSVTRDKWLTVQFFQQLGLSTPQSWLPDSLPSDLNYPLFIKPRSGSAAKNAFRVQTPRELEFFVNYVPDPIIQEYLPGSEITTDVVCDLNGEVLAVVSRRRIEVRWGEVAKGVTVYDPAITMACLQIARALPAVGPITVQCILKDNQPYFTEINARMGGGLPLAIAAGVDVPALLLARAAGLPIEIPPLGQYQTGLYMTRFDDSYFLTQAQYDQLASHHL